MASALTDILGERLAAGVITTTTTGHAQAGAVTPKVNSTDNLLLNGHWRAFAGGHPLPNRQSLEAARAAFDLLRRADDERALLIFLISGGGSAMIEWPRDENITLEELQATNRALVSCGAGIAEINAVRRAISAVKGGGLSSSAPRCHQVSLIISDTNAGEEEAVASGPTFDPPNDAPDAASIIKRYKLEESLPESILRAIEQPSQKRVSFPHTSLRKHYVLLDNASALEAAAQAARARNFAVDISRDIVEQPIEEGCSHLLSRLFSLRDHFKGRVVCLISGGEFACPVRGRGTGGRNSESVLRWAIELDEPVKKQSNFPHVVTLSAGTDGIDGNSPAAGAIADEMTVERARKLHLDARRFLDESDAYSFFHSLNDAVITGATGTNVRDLRIMLASP
jgi:hydroxypyruvate reductase